MGGIYQLTFFIALALLAVVVTIFVYAVSQVGRATNLASKEQEVILWQQKEAKKRRIEKLQKRLEEAKETGHLDKFRLIDEILKTEGEIASYNDKLKHLEERVTLLTRRGAVIWPSGFFAATLALNIIASGIAASQNPAAFTLWLASLGTLGYGIFRVFKTLGAIQEVTISSEEALEKLPEAVKKALKELEEEKKPILKLGFLEAQPPFHTEVESEMAIKFTTSLERGDIASKVAVVFFAPPGFEFLGSPKGPLPSKKYVSYVSTEFDLKEIIRPIDKVRWVKLKAPSQPNRYTLVYRVYCEGFDSGSKEFELIVEEPDIPF